MIVQRQQGRWLDLFSVPCPNMIGRLSKIVSEAEQMAIVPAAHLYTHLPSLLLLLHKCSIIVGVYCAHFKVTIEVGISACNRKSLFRLSIV